MDALVSLSIAANVAAIIPLADTAFKTGTQVFDLYCRYRDASLSISQLVDEIKAATSNIAQARIFIQEFAASAFAIDNGHTLPQVQQLLCLIDQEFKLLRKLMQDTRPSSSRTSSWLDRIQQVSCHMRWSLGDHKVAASCTRLQRLSTHMSNALAITGRRNEIILRNEITATRAEVIKFADTAKRLEDSISALAIGLYPSSSLNANPPTQLPSKKSNTQHCGPRLTSRRVSDPTTTAETTREIIDVEPHLIDDPRPVAMSKLSLWHHESGMIEVLSPVSEAMTLPLTCVRGILRKAIDDGKLSDYLPISNGKVAWVAFVIDQLLAQSHLAAAASLSLESQRFIKARNQVDMPGGADTSSTIGRETLSRPSAETLLIQGPSPRKRGLEGLWTTQASLKTTPWGVIKVEIHLIGGRLDPELLCSRVSFSPDRQPWDNGVVITYMSHHIYSLVRIYRQPRNSQGHTAVPRIDSEKKSHPNFKYGISADSTQRPTLTTEGWCPKVFIFARARNDRTISRIS